MIYQLIGWPARSAEAPELGNRVADAEYGGGVFRGYVTLPAQVVTCS